jgi:hypothetical protein
VVDGAHAGPFFGDPPGELAEGEALALVDPAHCLAAASGMLDGWEGASPLIASADVRNFRRVVAGAVTERPFVLELFPPDGGAVLRCSLPLLSRFERDPAAPILFERCVAWALEEEASAWRSVALRLGEAEGLAERLAELGMAGGEAFPEGRDGLLLVSVEEAGNDVYEWVSRGGKAVVLVPGSPWTAPSRVVEDAVTRGLSAGLVRRLCEESARGEDEWYDLGTPGRRRPLVEGLLDRIELGRGGSYVLRVGPPVEELTQAWREFLLQVFTNLGVRLGEAGRDE